MLFGDLCTQLAFGELGNLSAISDAVAGTIKTPALPKITNYTNEALLKLYSRFVLKENDLLLQLYPHITYYHLIPRFAVSYTPTGSVDNEPIRYILDTNYEPFADELLKVLSIHDMDGCKVPLNDENDDRSVFSPQDKLLQVPNPEDNTYLNLRFQQRHTKIQAVLSEEIVVPDVLMTALTSYIAYKTFSHMNSDNSTAKAQEFLALYERECDAVVANDLVGSSVSQTNSRFDRGGWV